MKSFRVSYRQAPTNPQAQRCARTNSQTHRRGLFGKFALWLINAGTLQKIIEHIACRDTAENRRAFRVQGHCRKSQSIPPAGRLQKLIGHSGSSGTAYVQGALRMYENLWESSRIFEILRISRNTEESPNISKQDLRISENPREPQRICENL